MSFWVFLHEVRLVGWGYYVTVCWEFKIKQDRESGLKIKHRKYLNKTVLVSNLCFSSTISTIVEINRPSKKIPIFCHDRCCVCNVTFGFIWRLAVSRDAFPVLFSYLFRSLGGYTCVFRVQGTNYFAIERLNSSTPSRKHTYIILHPPRGGSNEDPQSMFLSRNIKKYQNFFIWKVSVFGGNIFNIFEYFEIYRRVFVMQFCGWEFFPEYGWPSIFCLYSKISLSKANKIRKALNITTISGII